MNWLKQLPWRRLLLIFVTGAVSYFLVPVILSRLYYDVRGCVMDRRGGQLCGAKIGGL